MKNRRIKAELILLGITVVLVVGEAHAGAIDQGLTLPANTNASHQSASIARDSGLSQPLDLLNDFYPAIGADQMFRNPI